MSILDAQRYVESMTRREIADALKKGGHPLVPTFVLADRAEQLKKNDAAVKKLEQMVGIPAPNQDISSKLAQYLETSMRAQEVGGRGAPNMPGQGPSGPMPTPGVPPVPGGAGGPMPSMSRMPQGGAMTSGMPMAGGGPIPRYQDGGVVEEEDFMGDLAVADGMEDVGSALAAMREEAEAGRLTTELPETALSRYLSGFPDRMAAANRNAIAGTTYAGTRGTSRFSPQVMMPELSNAAEPPSGIAALEDMFKRQNEQDQRRVRSLYDTLSGRLGDMRTAATTETGAEKDLREAREGFAQRIRSRKQDIRDLLPTEEQDKLKGSATMLELISDTLAARATDPANSGFGRIARGMREYGDRKLQRDLGIEELMFGLDQSAFEMEDRNRAGLAALSRAGERYDDPEFKLMLAQYEAQQEALLEAQKGRQGLYKPAQWASVINFLQSPESVELPEADRTRIQQILVQSMTGGATGMPPGTTELVERLTAGDLSEEEERGLLGTLARTLAGAGAGAAVGSMTPLGPFGIIPGAIVGGASANVFGG